MPRILKQLSDTDSSCTSNVTSTSCKRRSAWSSSLICSWMSCVWLTTRAMPVGNHCMVPLPPMSLHDSGATVCVIRRISTSASFSGGSAFVGVPSPGMSTLTTSLFQLLRIDTRPSAGITKSATE